MKSPVLAFGAVLTLGALLRLAGLGTESFWVDEAWTWSITRGSPAQLCRTLIDADAHPPLYYLLVMGWTRIFGTSETALRLLSALFGIGALPLVYLLALRLADPAAGLWAMLFASLASLHVYFSQEARSYALLFLLGAASMVVLFDLAQAPTWKMGVLFGLLTAAVMYTHYMGAFLILGEVAAAIVLARGRPGFFKIFAIACAGAFVLFIPWLPAFHKHLFKVGGDFWIPALTFNGFLKSMYELVSYAWGMKFGVGFLLTAPFYALAVSVPVLDRRRELAALFLLLAVPVAGQLLVSLARPVFYTRTFLYALAPLFVLAAIALARIPSRGRTAAKAFLAMALVPGLVYVHALTEKENWREAVRRLREGSRQDEVVVILPDFLEVSVNYYAGTAPLPPRLGLKTLDRGDPELARRLQASTGIWVILRYGEEQGLSEILGPGFVRRLLWQEHGAEVRHYRRR